MNYVIHHDLKISNIGLGARSFGATDRNVSHWEQVLEYALDNGINLIDTAPLYLNGRSDEVLGRILKGNRQRVLLSTKVGTHGDQITLTPSAMRQSLEMSLRQLKTDYIDILHVHYPEPRVDYAEILQELQSFKNAGYIRHYGLSNFYPRELSRWPMSSPPLSLQLPYSLIQADHFHQVHPCLKKHDIIPFVYTPLGAGLLATPLEALDNIKGVAKMLYHILSEADQAQLTYWHGVADRLGIKLAVLALAWALNSKENVVLVGLEEKQHVDAALEGLKWSEREAIVGLQSIQQPKLPLEGQITRIIKKTENESLVEYVLPSINSISVALWIEGRPSVGDSLLIDGLTGNPM